MTSGTRSLALTLVLGLLLPVIAPFVQGLGSGPEVCGCRIRCCRAPQGPAPVNAPCHGPRRDAPSCSLRCNHSGSDAPLPAVAGFLPEADASIVALLPQAPVTRAPRPEPRPGFGRIDSPPPRPLLLAI